MKEIQVENSTPWRTNDLRALVKGVSGLLPYSKRPYRVRFATSSTVWVVMEHFKHFDRVVAFIPNQKFSNVELAREMHARLSQAEEPGDLKERVRATRSLVRAVRSIQIQRKGKKKRFYHNKGAQKRQ